MPMTLLMPYPVLRKAFTCLAQDGAARACRISRPHRLSSFPPERGTPGHCRVSGPAAKPIGDARGDVSGCKHGLFRILRPVCLRQAGRESVFHCPPSMSASSSFEPVGVTRSHHSMELFRFQPRLAAGSGHVRRRRCTVWANQAEQTPFTALLRRRSFWSKPDCLQALQRSHRNRHGGRRAAGCPHRELTISTFSRVRYHRVELIVPALKMSPVRSGTLVRKVSGVVVLNDCNFGQHHRQKRGWRHIRACRADLFCRVSRLVDRSRHFTSFRRKALGTQKKGIRHSL